MTTHQRHRDVVAEVETGRVIHRSRVHVERQTVAGEGVTKAPQLDAPLHWLLGRVLLPCQPPVVANDRLVDREVLTRSKTAVEVLREDGDERPHTGQLVVSDLVGRKGAVKVLEKFLIATSRHHACHEGVVQYWFIRPTVPVVREILQAHGDVDANEGPHLVLGRRVPVQVRRGGRVVARLGGRPLAGGVSVRGGRQLRKEVGADHLMEEVDGAGVVRQRVRRASRLADLSCSTS